MVGDEATPEVPEELETLEERFERQRLVIQTQGEILDALGFDAFEIADASEKATPETRRSRRGRRVATMVAAGWLAPGPWFFVGDHALLHAAITLLV